MPFSSSGERHFSCGFLSAGILCSDFSTCDSRPYRAGCPGDLEIWRFGDFSCRSIPFAPLSVAGIPKPFRMEALCRTADFFRGLPEGEGNRVKNIWSGSEVKNDGPVGSRRYFRYFYGSAKKRGGSRSRTRDSDCREAVRSARMRRYGVFRTNRRPN